MRKTEGSPLPFGAAAKERKVNFSVQVPMGKTSALQRRKHKAGSLL